MPQFNIAAQGMLSRTKPSVLRRLFMAAQIATKSAVLAGCWFGRRRMGKAGYNGVCQLPTSPLRPVRVKSWWATAYGRYH